VCYISTETVLCRLTLFIIFLFHFPCDFSTRFSILASRFVLSRTSPTHSSHLFSGLLLYPVYSMLFYMYMYIHVHQAAGVLLPHYDPDANILYAAGKGDGNIRYWEYIDDQPHIFALSE